MYYFADAVGNPYYYHQVIESHDWGIEYVPNYTMTEEFWIENESKSRFGKGAWQEVGVVQTDEGDLAAVTISFGYGLDDSSGAMIDPSNCSAKLNFSAMNMGQEVPVSIDADSVYNDNDCILARFDVEQTGLVIMFSSKNPPKLEARLIIGGGSMKKWTCTTCGYVAEGTQPPTECPNCGMSDFVTT